jgi:hypothetical protein
VSFYGTVAEGEKPKSKLALPRGLSEEFALTRVVDVDGGGGVGRPAGLGVGLPTSETPEDAEDRHAHDHDDRTRDHQPSRRRQFLVRYLARSESRFFRRAVTRQKTFCFV